MNRKDKPRFYLVPPPPGPTRMERFMQLLIEGDLEALDAMTARRRHRAELRVVPRCETASEVSPSSDEE